MSFVYIMRRENGHRKVGLSGVPSERRRAIRRDIAAVSLIVERSFETSYPRFVEHEAHRILTKAGCHVVDEWFSVPLEECERAIEAAIDLARTRPPFLSEELLAAFFAENATEHGELRVDAVRKLLSLAVEAAGGMRRFAQANGLTVQYVSLVLKGRTSPSDRVCHVLGVRPAGMRWVETD